MSLLNFRKMTEEEVKEREQTSVKVKLSPQEKFDNLIKHLHKQNKIAHKFHWKIIVNETKLHLFRGDGKEFGTYEKSNNGCRDARRVALALFCAAGYNKPKGGFTIDLVIGLRQYDASLGIDFLDKLEEEEEENIA